MSNNYFIELNSLDVGDKIEKKNGLSYLSWAYAWGELKKRFPKANYKVYETADGMNYFNDGKTAWVKTGVTVEDIEHIEYLPIMDFRNKSIPVDNITSFDVNKAIQRSLTKAVARHGLGLYIYAGEDLPESSDDVREPSKEPATVAQVEAIFKARRVEELVNTDDIKNIEEYIDECKTTDALKVIYETHKKLICATPNLLDKITEKGKKLKGAA